MGSGSRAAAKLVGALIMGETSLRPYQTTLPQILRVKGFFSGTHNLRIIETILIGESWGKTCRTKTGWGGQGRRRGTQNIIVYAPASEAQAVRSPQVRSAVCIPSPRPTPQ